MAGSVAAAAATSLGFYEAISCIPDAAPHFCLVPVNLRTAAFIVKQFPVVKHWDLASWEAFGGDINWSFWGRCPWACHLNDLSHLQSFSLCR